MWCGEEHAFKPGTGMYVSVMGDSFLCRVSQLEIRVRATVGSSRGYSAALDL